MLERYTRPEMGNIWTEQNKYQAWLEVEILADEAWAELGEIPKEDVKKIREHASFDIERILEIEKETPCPSLKNSCPQKYSRPTRRNATSRFPKVCGPSAPAVKRFCTRPIWKRTRTSALTAVTIIASVPVRA